MNWLPLAAGIAIVGVVCGWLGWLLRDEAQMECERVRRVREAANRELYRGQTFRKRPKPIPTDNARKE